MEHDQFIEMFENVKQSLKNEMVDIKNYDTYINDLKFLKISSNTVYFEVPDNTSKHVIENRYLKLIKEKFLELYKKNVKIILTTTSEKKDIRNYHSTMLDTDKIFEEFIVGNNNEYARAIAFSVAQKPGEIANPLFIHGASGLGKSHLLQAIGNYIIEHNEDWRVIYISAEKFLTDMIHFISNSRQDEFKNKYRVVDVLIIDDIQTLKGKESTQEEFFHTFNTLTSNKKQIVIASDKPPKELFGFEERLKTRFSQGVIQDIKPPDFETRVAILKRKSQKDNIEISDEILIMIANHITTNIRELEGALNGIAIMSKLTKQPITPELAKSKLSDFINKEPVKSNVEGIKSVVADYFKIRIEHLNSDSKVKEYAKPRQIAMYLAREMTDLSFPNIGEKFGRSHSTIISAYEKIKKGIKEDIILKAEIEEILSLLKN